MTKAVRAYYEHFMILEQHGKTYESSVEHHYGKETWCGVTDFRFSLRVVFIGLSCTCSLAVFFLVSLISDLFLEELN